MGFGEIVRSVVGRLTLNPLQLSVAHRVKLMPYSTFRLNLSVTVSFFL